MSSLLTEDADHRAPLAAREAPFIPLTQVHIRHDAPVLLVDDDPHIAPLVEVALSPFHVRFDAVGSGADALARLRRRKYDLLVLDLGLADVHGFDVLRHLRAQPALKDTKVLVLTANTSLEALARSFGHGADDFVKKPFDVHELGMRAFRLLHCD